MSETYHYSVLLKESVDYLNISPDGIYIDGTLGMGGHSYEIARRLKHGKLISFDKDSFAIEHASEKLKDFSDRVIFVHDDFRNIPDVLDSLGISEVNGMVFDFGVSSPQLDNSERGFSYMTDSPLDMRMNTESTLTAYDIVNTWSQDELNRILWDYGEERYARRISDAILRYRVNAPIESTGCLCDLIRSAMPAQALREKQHPAKRTFQAIRIAVNDELGSIEEMMNSAPDRLISGGRFCAITFHSLEDRIVKRGIASRENGCTCPREAPVCTCGFVQTLRSVTRKPVLPSKEELDENPRSRSAKLRVAEKV